MIFAVVLVISKPDETRASAEGRERSERRSLWAVPGLSRFLLLIGSTFICWLLPSDKRGAFRFHLLQNCKALPTACPPLARCLLGTQSQSRSPHPAAKQTNQGDDLFSICPFRVQGCSLAKPLFLGMLVLQPTADLCHGYQRAPSACLAVLRL